MPGYKKNTIKPKIPVGNKSYNRYTLFRGLSPAAIESIIQELHELKAKNPATSMSYASKRAIIKEIIEKNKLKEIPLTQHQVNLVPSYTSGLPEKIIRPIRQELRDKEDMLLSLSSHKRRGVIREIITKHLKEMWGVIITEGEIPLRNELMGSKKTKLLKLQPLEKNKFNMDAIRIISEKYKNKNLSIREVTELVFSLNLLSEEEKINFLKNIKSKSYSLAELRRRLMLRIQIQFDLKNLNPKSK